MFSKGNEKSSTIRRWMERIPFRSRRRRLEAIDDKVVFQDPLHFAVVESSEKKNGSITEREDSFTVVQDKKDPRAAPPVTFQSLPLEIRYLIYSFILPQKRRLILLTGKEEQAPTFLPLLETSNAMRMEFRRWFKGIENYQNRFWTTSQYGLIDQSSTYFALVIDDAFRDREICKVNESQGFRALEPNCKCCKKFKKVLLPVDRQMITSLALHFKTEDTLGRRDNLNAVKTLTKLRNLQNLDILLGDVGRRWKYGREVWQGGGGEEGRCWIPTCLETWVALVPLENELLPFSIRVWIVVLGADRKDRVELLVSYNGEVGKRRSVFPITELCSVMEG